jgi:hypothetical protein
VEGVGVMGPEYDFNSGQLLEYEKEVERKAIEGLSESLKREVNDQVLVHKSAIRQNLNGASKALELAQVELAPNLTGHFGQATLTMMKEHKRKIDLVTPYKEYIKQIEV